MISLYSLSESETWDEIVKSFQEFDVYYLSDYTRAFNIHGDGEPFLVYYKTKELRAINVIMKRDINQDIRFQSLIEPDTYFDITTPYGYGGFIFEGDPSFDNLKKLNQTYTEFCRSQNIVSEFVRFHPLLKNSESNRILYDVIDLGKTVTIRLGSKQQIWKELTGKNRNVIRKSIKSGVEIYWGISPDLVGKFIPLYNSTMTRDNATAYYYFDLKFYESILTDLKYKSLIFYGVYDKEIISMAIILLGKNFMHYHLSSSGLTHQNLAANNLLLYEAACWGSENGYKLFHLGGGLGSKEDGLFKFKEAFNTKTETHFSIGRKIFDPKKYQELLNLRGDSDPDSDPSAFFPRYRS